MNLRTRGLQLKMGKAKRKLMAARADCYDPICDEPPEVHDDPEYKRQVEEEKIMDTSVLLRARLMDYTEHGAYPLCEFLDINNVENYVRWVLHNA